MRKLTLLAALACFLVVPAGAHAGLVLDLDDGVGNSVTIMDNGAGDSNPLLGAVTFNGALGNWIVNVTTGISKPLLGPLPTLDLNSVNVTSGTGTLLILLTDTDYSGSAGSTTFTSSIGGTTQGSVTWATWFDDPGNLPFGTQAAFDVFASGAFSATHHFSALTTGSPFSMTQGAFITHTSGSQVTSFDALITVPEPGTMMLLGLGFLTLGLTRRLGR